MKVKDFMLTVSAGIFTELGLTSISEEMKFAAFIFFAIAIVLLIFTSKLEF